MTTTSPTLKAPKQPRSQRTLERIERAGVELLQREGPTGVTVQAVVARARSSVGSFYARFPGKDDFLAHLEHLIRDDELARWGAAADAEPWQTLGLAGAIERSVSLLRDALVRREEQSGSGQGPAAEAHRSLWDTLLRDLEAHLLEHEGEIAHPDAQLAVRLALSAANGALATHAGADRPPIPEDVLVRETRDLVVAYLLGGSPDAGSGGKVDFFDAWG
ncbi:MAG: TetR/AcrR family transcriptional regulator [Gemmatimonadota bacterium]